MIESAIYTEILETSGVLSCPEFNIDLSHFVKDAGTLWILVSNVFSSLSS